MTSQKYSSTSPSSSVRPSTGDVSSTHEASFRIPKMTSSTVRSSATRICATVKDASALTSYRCRQTSPFRWCYSTTNQCTASGTFHLTTVSTSTGTVSPFWQPDSLGRTQPLDCGPATTRTYRAPVTDCALWPVGATIVGRRSTWSIRRSRTR